MLKHLHIENYALIESLSVGFPDGLTVITGETGAGKSILLGGLSLILGQRADTRVLNDKSRKCIIEGTFSIRQEGLKEWFAENELDYDALTLVRREITPQGKSRAFINDTPVTLNTLREFTEKLVDIHSQHQTLLISDPSFPYEVLDSVAGNTGLLLEYTALLGNFRKKMALLEKTREAEEKARAEADYNRFQFVELEKSLPVAERFHEMDQELALHENAESIRQHLESALGLIEDAEYNATDMLSSALNHLRHLETYAQDLALLSQRLESLLIELRDVAADCRKKAQATEYDPLATESLRSVIDQVNRLLLKHRKQSIEELHELKDGFGLRLEGAESLGQQILDMEAELNSMQKSLGELAGKISAARKKAIPSLEAEMMRLLKQLGMPAALFRAEIKESAEMNSWGTDRLQFLFSANLGARPEELSRVASGGEMSRVMLAVKSLLSAKNRLSGIILDEIDTGISGEIATRVAHILENMASHMQVIAITHLPQIAARGNSHLLVYKVAEKGRTLTRIRDISGDDRITELAIMLGGANPSASMISTARELVMQTNSENSNKH